MGSGERDAGSASETRRSSPLTHNFVLLSLFCRMLNLPLAKFRGLRQDLAAVSLVDLSAGRSASSP